MIKIMEGGVYVNKRHSRAKKKGFTLIELLVVLGIIGVLVLAAAPTMVSKVAEAKEKTDVSNASSIAMAVKTEGNLKVSGEIGKQELTRIANEYFDGKLPTSQSLESDFTVTVTNNIITVKAGETEFYPNYVDTAAAGR